MHSLLYGIATCFQEGIVVEPDLRQPKPMAHNRQRNLKMGRIGRKGNFVASKRKRKEPYQEQHAITVGGESRTILQYITGSGFADAIPVQRAFLTFYLQKVLEQDSFLMSQFEMERS
tara:strand:+ start:943 stop:1293 length:351 start_codon:yes stop_codon:yes gene_type:complete